MPYPIGKSIISKPYILIIAHVKYLFYPQWIIIFVRLPCPQNALQIQYEHLFTMTLSRSIQYRILFLKNIKHQYSFIWSAVR
jgi:hypothetical protein